jgi:hypothetical protein
MLPTNKTRASRTPGRDVYFIDSMSSGWLYYCCRRELRTLPSMGVL